VWAVLWGPPNVGLGSGKAKPGIEGGNLGGGVVYSLPVALVPGLENRETGRVAKM
jgi:hypothetical protein